MGKGDDKGQPDHVSGQSNKPMSAPAHALSYDQVAEELQANTMNGLSTSEAKSRLEVHGRNEFGESEGVQPLKIFVGQIANALTLVSELHS
jgi:P-type Na+/K+ transporter